MLCRLIQTDINETTMYCAKCAPVEHYPKSLRHSEVQNPLSVIADVFSAGGVKNHRRDLTARRDGVIEGKYFNFLRRFAANRLEL